MKIKRKCIDATAAADDNTTPPRLVRRVKLSLA